MTPAQPTLSLWDEPMPDHTHRIVADSSDRVSWLRARSRGITATDVAKLATENSVRAVVADKMLGSRFSGNTFTEHGREREPEIARWVLERFEIEPSTSLYHATHNERHLATPDGVSARSGTLQLCEIKTTSKPWRSIPRGYLRQVWWQQYVLGAERTLLVWEQHEDFVPIHGEPQFQWIDRDDDQIHMLVRLADRVLEALGAVAPPLPPYRPGGV